MNQWPKVELHLHLDCNLSYGAAAQLKPGLTPEDYRRAFIAPAWCPDNEVFFSCTRNAVALMQDEAALWLVVEDTFHQLEQDHVLYAEIRFAPLLHTRGGLSAREVVSIVTKAVRDNSARTGIEAGVILATLRHFSGEQSLETARLALQFAGHGVVGFDIAGNEELYPLQPHVPAFEMIIAHGLPFTVHAGEGQGPQSVWDVLDRLRPKRLGHGVRASADPALVQRLRDEGVHLEVCPTANVQMNVVPSYAAHPIDRLCEAGISCGINTDTRTTSDITLEREYDKLRQQFGWTIEHFRRANRNALGAAFLAPDRVAALAQKLDASYQGQKNRMGAAREDLRPW
jgi:adenosine deaminase